MTGRIKWFCPPELGRGPGPWCEAEHQGVKGPCRGHRVTTRHLSAAEVLAWGDGYEDPQALPSDRFAEYLTTTALALYELEYEVAK